MEDRGARPDLRGWWGEQRGAGQGEQHEQRREVGRAQKIAPGLEKPRGGAGHRARANRTFRGFYTKETPDKSIDLDNRLHRKQTFYLFSPDLQY